MSPPAKWQNREEIFKMKKEVLNLDEIRKKTVLSFSEGCAYMGVSHSTMYKKTARRVIPHYKPAGKKVYFNRLELDAWLQRNRVTPLDELTQTAQDYCLKAKQRGR